MYYTELISSIKFDNSAIIGREKYLNTAVLIPIVEIDQSEYLLFQKRSQSVRQPGEVSFPGGHFESDKDIDFVSTAIRETCEELGLKQTAISILAKLGTLVAPMGIIVETYIGKLNIKSLDDLNIDKNEVEKVFIVPVEYFIENSPSEFVTRLEVHPYTKNENGEIHDLLPVKELGLPDRYSVPWTRGKHRVLVYKNTEEIIWGITAELVFELSKKIKEKIDI